MEDIQDNNLPTNKVENTFVCEICKKRFLIKGELKKHLKMHAGEKPCVCEICNRESS